MIESIIMASVLTLPQPYNRTHEDEIPLMNGYTMTIHGYANYPDLYIIHDKFLGRPDKMWYDKNRDGAVQLDEILGPEDVKFIDGYDM